MSEVTFADLIDAGQLAIGDGHRARLSELEGSGPLFLRAGALSESGFDWRGLDAFSDPASPGLRGKHGVPGDVVITTKGNSIGRVGQVPDAAPAFIYSPHLSYWRSGDHEAVWPAFLYYWARSDQFRLQLRERAFNTDMAPYLSLRDQASLRIRLPRIETQRAISGVLGALDDKIAANRRILEAADGLIRAWFVSLDGDLIRLGDIATSVRDIRVPEGGGNYVGLEHLPRRLMWVEAHGHASTVSSLKSAFLPGDVLFGKLRPYFHKVARAPWAGIASTDILTLRAKDPDLAGLVLAAASSDRAIALADAASEGTRMPRAKWADLAAMAFAGGGAVGRKLSNAVQPLADLCSAIAHESLLLGATRDELLPLLLSDRVRVRDLEGSA